LRAAMDNVGASFSVPRKGSDQRPVRRQNENGFTP
jgi:hypothetical protein